MATYPVRNPDGTLRRRKGAAYPHNLPTLRPWMSAGLQQQQPQQQPLKAEQP